VKTGGDTSDDFLWLVGKLSAIIKFDNIIQIINHFSTKRRGRQNGPGLGLGPAVTGTKFSFLPGPGPGPGLNFFFYGDRDRDLFVFQLVPVCFFY
jgi:hypothetical protein